MGTLKGHGLVAEGAPHDIEGQRLAWAPRTWPGRARCACGELSPSLPSVSQRREWHRKVHKPQVALAAMPLEQAERIGHVRMRSDGRYEVADRDDSFLAFGCRSGCCLARDHEGDHVLTSSPEVWSGSRKLYVPPAQ